MQVSYGNVSLINLISSTIYHCCCFSYEAIFSQIERKYIFDDDSSGEEADEDSRVRNKLLEIAFL